MYTSGKKAAEEVFGILRNTGARRKERIRKRLRDEIEQGKNEERRRDGHEE